MRLSSGFEVAEFAFLLDPFVNVSKLFQRRRDTPWSSFNLQIDMDTISLCKRLNETKQCTVYRGDIAPQQQSLLLLLLPQGRLNRVNCFIDPRRFTVYFEPQTDCSVVLFGAPNVSLCWKNVFLFSLWAEVRVMLEATESIKTRVQVLVVEIIVLDPQETTGHCTMNRLC